MLPESALWISQILSGHYLARKIMLTQQTVHNSKDRYRKNSKYWDIYVWANSVDSDQTALKEQSDQDLHCLPFFLHLLEALLQCKIKLFYIKDNYGSWYGCPNI